VTDELQANPGLLLRMAPLIITAQPLDILNPKISAKDRDRLQQALESLVGEKAKRPAGGFFDIRPATDALKVLKYLKQKGPLPARSPIRSELRAKEPVTPRQQARLENIRQQFGVIDPSSGIYQATEPLIRAAFKNLGISEEDYLYVISDSDEINAYLQGGGEKIVVFNYGLLKFLEEYDILDEDSVTFIMGHELGHALQLERKDKDTDYRPSNLAMEYDADDHGFIALDRSGRSPYAGLRVLEAMREEQVKGQVSWLSHYMERTTHPPTHRRQVNANENIRRRNYWRHLNASRGEIPYRAEAVERSGRYHFDSGLYANFSFRNLRDSIGRAASRHALLKLINLFHILLNDQVVLNEMMAYKQNGFSESGIVLPVNRHSIEGILTGKDHPWTARTSKFLIDEGVDPYDYFTAEQISEIKKHITDIQREKAGQGISVVDISEQDLLYQLLAEEVNTQRGFLQHAPTMNIGRFGPFAIAVPQADQERARKPGE